MRFFIQQAISGHRAGQHAGDHGSVHSIGNFGVAAAQGNATPLADGSQFGHDVADH
jgi:hypothetical protein